jgi:hypothetical protein
MTESQSRSLWNSPYRYNPLNKALEEIRLVRIDKAELGKRIHCTLQHVSMNAKPFYVALSYAWDNPFGKADQVGEHGEDIVINKRPFRTAKTLAVRYNLACALKTLPHGSSHWFWIDAICLNQSDVAERNEQVFRMGDIYSEALKVIAWLGPVNDNSGLAFALVRNIADRGTATDVVEARKWIESILSDEAFHYLWLAFVHLLKRTWWRRTWVLQELSQGKDLEVWCGTAQLDWLIFDGAFGVLTSDQVEKVSERFAPAGASNQVFDAFAAITFRINTRRRIFQGETMPLLYMLDGARSHKATDARDKLFALLSLIHKDERDLVVVDYNISARALYISFARRCIEATGDLQIVTLAQENDPADFPSWVPDWTRTQIELPLSLVLKTGLYFDVECCAHKGKRSRCHFSDDLESLICQGVCFDNVDGLGSYNYTGVDLEDRKAVQSSFVESAYGSVEATFEANWRSVCGNVERLKGRWELLGDFGAHFAKLWLDINAGKAHAFNSIINMRVASILSEAGVLRLGGWTIHDLVLERSESLEVIEAPHDMQQRWFDVLAGTNRIMGGRRFLTTQQGYVGWAPRFTRKGDKIFVLLGCRTPVILRPQGDTFQLIGECYIHGIMYGEVIDELEAGKYQLQDVTIV